MVLVALKAILLMNKEIIFYVGLLFKVISPLTPVVDQMWSTSSTQNLTDGLTVFETVCLWFRYQSKRLYNKALYISNS